MQQSNLASNSSPALSWLAGIGLLCVIPILLFMLFLDEIRFMQWLPLITLVKALGIPGCLIFIVRTAPKVTGFASINDFTLLPGVLSAAFFILCDSLIALYCFRRSRILCK